MIDPLAVGRAVALLDRWLEGMRAAGGYGGPVVHWWRDCLVFCGPALDWRYEGIIDGYLTMFERTHRLEFLEKARRAGEDLVRGQLADGTFRNSSFERNPRSGGTPHEAAADIGLLLLARALRGRSDPDWEHYLEVAERNIRRFLMERLWSEDHRRFGDGGESFVPNKAATIIEAVCLLAELTDRDEYLAQFVAPTADAILEYQVMAPGDPLDGGIAQAELDGRRTGKFFPYYVARTIPGLCAAYRAIGDERYVEGARRAGAFAIRWRDEDGGSPQVVYPGGRLNRYPRWIAGAGDLVRALDSLAPYGFTAGPEPTLRWILAGQLPSGAIRAAEGFGSQVSQRVPRGALEIRDVLPVAGWNDKAFRALARRVVDVDTSSATSTVSLGCTWRGRRVDYRENAEGIEVDDGRSAVYRWRKGEPWAFLA